MQRSEDRKRLGNFMRCSLFGKPGRYFSRFGTFPVVRLRIGDFLLPVCRGYLREPKKVIARSGHPHASLPSFLRQRQTIPIAPNAARVRERNEVPSGTATLETRLDWLVGLGWWSAVPKA